MKALAWRVVNILSLADNALFGRDNDFLTNQSDFYVQEGQTQMDAFMMVKCLSTYYWMKSFKNRKDSDEFMSWIEEQIKKEDGFLK